jgi:hypothetical protein
MNHGDLGIIYINLSWYNVWIFFAIEGDCCRKPNHDLGLSKVVLGYDMLWPLWKERSFYMGFWGFVSDKLQDVNGGILGAHELQMPWLLRRNNWSKGAEKQHPGHSRWFMCQCCQLNLRWILLVSSLADLNESLVTNASSLRLLGWRYSFICWCHGAPSLQLNHSGALGRCKGLIHSIGFANW